MQAGEVPGTTSINTGPYPEVPGVGAVDTGPVPEMPGTGTVDTGPFPEIGNAPGAALENANYAQRTFSQSFSNGGTFAGQTIDEVAAGLRSGQLSAADVPVQYIVRDGNTLILNTRSAQALESAGIPRSQWNAVNMTGDAAAEARLTAQLQRNNLTSQGIPTVAPSGGN